MADRPPAFVRSLLEQRSHGHGMGISDLAALSNLVHKEAFTETGRIDMFAGWSLGSYLGAEPHGFTALGGVWPSAGNYGPACSGQAGPEVEFGPVPWSGSVPATSARPAPGRPGPR